MAPIIVQATVSVSYAILARPAVVPRPGCESRHPDLGPDPGRWPQLHHQAWWLGVFPGLAIMLTVLSINFIGDALRDALDVRDADV